jgi:hypothetical protein
MKHMPKMMRNATRRLKRGSQGVSAGTAPVGKPEIAKVPSGHPSSKLSRMPRRRGR